MLSRRVLHILWLALPWALTLPLSSATKAGHDVPSSLVGGAPNANHIFNALHNSMKEFGSVLHHNGMSFFLASVPEGTEFYHGTGSPFRINGTEWLAFEPEHAMTFAHPRRPGSGNPHKSQHQGSSISDHQPQKHRDDELRRRLGSSTNDGHGDDREHRDQDTGRHDDFTAMHLEHRNRHNQGQVPWAMEPVARPWEHPNHAGNRKSAWAQDHEEHIQHEQHAEGMSQTKQHIKDHADHEWPRVLDAAISNAETNLGYFHTYRTKHPLRLVYFDGQSAAKSLKGTLDTQDIVLRNASHFDGSPAKGDDLRAEELCAMARDEWDNSVHGFLRMVGGFEIILCSFADDVDLVDIVATYPDRNGDGGSGLSYAKALATRFDGIGGHRVSVDYEDFVTMLSFPEAMYFDHSGLPRVHNDSSKLQHVRHHIKDLLKRSNSPHNNTIDWQAVTDMIVARYSYRIELMLSHAAPDHHALRRHLHLALEPFLDSRSHDSPREVQRCVSQFWPSRASTDTVAAQAVHIVSRHLCSKLVEAAAAETYEEGISLLRELKAYLNWADFKKCKGCKLDEVCLIPIWPTGSASDFMQPKCGKGRAHGAGGYWDMMGRHRDT